MGFNSGFKGLTVFKEGAFLWLSDITFKQDDHCMLKFCKLASHGGRDNNRCRIKEHINIKESQVCLISFRICTFQ